MTATTESGVVFPPENLDTLLDLARFLELHTEPALLLGPDGEQAPLPQEIYRILVKVVEALREGKVITVVPQTQRLTTQEAADFLGVSGPTLVKLLDQGKIPYEQPGRTARSVLRSAPLHGTAAGATHGGSGPDDRRGQLGWHSTAAARKTTPPP